MAKVEKGVVPGGQQVATPQRNHPIRKFFKSFVNVGAWVSYHEVKNNINNLRTLIKRINPRNAAAQEVRQETFAEVIARFGFTQEQLLMRERGFLRSAIIYLVFSLLFFSYFAYVVMFAKIRILPLLVLLLVVVFFVVAAYRQHLWYMQIRRKKLGCNFSDWLAFIGRRDGK